ncbi:MAG: hypothetical protein ACREQZ_11500, partial [Woeseiaceae bacterium]
LNVVYECPGGHGFKVMSCSGSGDEGSCDVQAYLGGQPKERGQSPRTQVLALVTVCRPQTSGQSGGASGGGTGQATAIATPQIGPAGIKVGDTVMINTAFGWVNAHVLSINGNLYRARAQTGAEVVKAYPTELRRIGPLTAYDRANGIYEVRDKVQVHFEGRWVESEILATLGMEYQVRLPGDRTAWAPPSHLRFVASAEKAAGPPRKTGQPPKPGLTSCAGKATVNVGLAGEDEVECWTGGGKIYLHTPGDPDDLVFDINEDGTIETPLGEIRKKSS